MEGIDRLRPAVGEERKSMNSEDQGGRSQAGLRCRIIGEADSASRLPTALPREGRSSGHNYVAISDTGHGDAGAVGEPRRRVGQWVGVRVRVGDQWRVPRKPSIQPTPVFLQSKSLRTAPSPFWVPRRSSKLRRLEAFTELQREGW